MKKFFKILKKIFISILIVFIALMAFGAILTKCGKADAQEHTASAATEEFEEVEEEVILSDMAAAPRIKYETIDYQNNLATKPYVNFSGSASSLSNNLVQIILANLPIATITFEYIEVLKFTDGVSCVIVSSDWANWYQFTDGHVTLTAEQIQGKEFWFLLRDNQGDLVDYKYNFNLYTYYGSYVPGYGQGLAAGIEQGYQNGYNQGAADTSAKYIAGIFGEATAQFGYTNQATYSSIAFSDLQLEVNDYVSFSGFPTLTTNYNYYVLQIDFPEKVHYSSGLFQFIFNNEMPLQANGFIPSLRSLDASFIRVSFNSSTTPTDFIFSNSNQTIPVVYVQGTNYSYEISSTWLSQNSVDFQSITICTKLIPDSSRYPEPYPTLQSLKFTNGYSDNANYYAGYDSGYNVGFTDGENKGYGNGIEVGYNNGYDTGLKEGEINGYTKAVAEGVSQEGIFYGAISFLRTFFQLTTQFLGTKIIGNITLGGIVIGLPAVGLIGNLAIGFVKKVMGSRGADE